MQQNHDDYCEKKVVRRRDTCSRHDVFFLLSIERSNQLLSRGGISSINQLAGSHAKLVPAKGGKVVSSSEEQGRRILIESDSAERNMFDPHYTNPSYTNRKDCAVPSTVPGIYDVLPSAQNRDAEPPGSLSESISNCLE
jgi:hypothetical protein